MEKSYGDQRRERSNFALSYLSQAGSGAYRVLLALSVFILIHFTSAVLQAASGDKLFWIEAAEILTANKDGTGTVDQVVGGLSIGFSLAIDEAGGKIYWSDRSTNKISRADIDGSNVEDLYSLGSNRPFAIALDPSNGDLYFASPDSKTISRGKMDGSASPVVIYDQNDASAAPDNGNSGNPGIRDVRGIALDVAAGMMYWTDRGTGADRVVRGTMDGTMVPQLLYTQVSGSAQIVALDIDAGMLYWTNSGRGQIERGKMDGSGDRLSLYAGTTGSGGGIVGLVLDIPNGDLYWTSTSSDDIRRGKMDGAGAAGGAATVVVSGQSNPWAPAISGGGGGTDDPPVITLLGADPFSVECGDVYSEPGATALDDVDGDISGSIVIDSSSVDTSTVGSYTVTYDVTDSGGNAATQLTRTVTVSDTTAPLIALLGSNPQVVPLGGAYVEAGSTVTDCEAGLVALIDASSVNTAAVGSYSVTYNVTDSSGNAAAQVTRTVNVVNSDPTVVVDLDPVTVDEGQTASNSGTFDDINVGDDVSLAYSVGTGTGSGGQGVGQSGAWNWSFTPTDGVDDSQLVTVTATDLNGGQGSGTFQLNVNNVAPSVAVDGGTVTVDEGQTAVNAGTMFDPGDDTVAISASAGSITSTTPVGPAVFDFQWLGGSSTSDTVTTSSTTLTAGIDITFTTANVGHFWSVVDNSGAIGGYNVAANADVTVSFSQPISSFRMHMWDLDHPDEYLDNSSVLPSSVDGDFSISGTQVVSSVDNGAGNLNWENLPAGTTSLTFTYVRPSGGGLLMDELEIPGGQGDWDWEFASTDGPP